MPLTPLCGDRGSIHPLIVRDLRGREGGGFGDRWYKFLPKAIFPDHQWPSVVKLEESSKTLLFTGSPETPPWAVEQTIYL